MIHQLKYRTGGLKDGRGVGGCGVHLSPWIHQEYTFRHRSACRTLAESPEEGNGNPLQYSCLENPMDSGAW